MEDNADSDFAEGQRIRHNFVKAHATLDGQTPAQVAGVGVKGRDKRMELFRHAIKK